MGAVAGKTVLPGNAVTQAHSPIIATKSIFSSGGHQKRTAYGALRWRSGVGYLSVTPH